MSGWEIAALVTFLVIVGGVLLACAVFADQEYVDNWWKERAK